MTDMGFMPQVTRLLDQVRPDGQRLLFSATLDRNVDQLVRRYLSDPVVHSVDPSAGAVTTMEHHLLHVDETDKRQTTTEIAARDGQVIMFLDTKHAVDRLTKHLLNNGVRAAGRTAASRSRSGRGRSPSSRTVTSPSWWRRTSPRAASTSTTSAWSSTSTRPATPRTTSTAAAARPRRRVRQRDHPGHPGPAARRHPADVPGGHHPAHHAGTAGRRGADPHHRCAHALRRPGRHHGPGRGTPPPHRLRPSRNRRRRGAPGRQGQGQGGTAKGGAQSGQDRAAGGRTRRSDDAAPRRKPRTKPSMDRAA